MKVIVQVISYGLFGLSIIGIDRFTKKMALAYCQTRYCINSFIACDVAFNRGISWGWLHSQNEIIFFLVSLMIFLITLAVAFYGAYRFYYRYCIAAEVMIIAGSLSNLIDRWHYQGVIDFIEFSYKGYSWPLFNCADASIVIGVLLMFLLHARS